MIKFILLKYTVSVFWCFHKVVQPVPLSKFRTISSPQKEIPYLLVVIPLALATTNLLLPLWIDLFWIFPVNRTIKYGTFETGSFHLA